MSDVSGEGHANRAVLDRPDGGFLAVVRRGENWSAQGSSFFSSASAALRAMSATAACSRARSAALAS
ncbi:hypothetical protein LX15_003616 [Streptoalloteichus tenebrarius]|uniref:Uncharacterized protein n=1 Tax=Streptoalloteichus tenebrarius (strain ATCC 17920 / DSM 40477 / JCM 4838 / CBS 697.72 / NBRC 16177 / NCIMB 11028 / NRRL B-12390 / A12253. 1 / ISP 5477) TaxID=1933 RepID=A0ABT1HWK1_STRSD|nr:hypothetical protein [Streptoalloteichus tenebrarius]